MGAETQLFKPSVVSEELGRRFVQSRDLPAAPGLEQGLAWCLAGVRGMPKSHRQPENMCTVWFREVKARLLSLGQDSGLVQDSPLSTEAVEHRAPLLGDAQLLGSKGDWVVCGRCRGELGE